MIRDCTDTKEHEDDRFRTATQHFHCIFDRCVRFQGNVGLYVILHGDTTERDSFDQ